jgi:hypothetical protein
MSEPYNPWKAPRADYSFWEASNRGAALDRSKSLKGSEKPAEIAPAKSQHPFANGAFQVPAKTL